MPQVINKRGVSGRHLFVGIGAFAGLLALVAGVGIWVWLNRGPAQPSMEELSNQVSRLEFQGKFDEAIRISKSKYNTLKTDKDRYQLALGIGAIYEMKSDYQQAITWYQKAKGLSSNTAKDRAVANGLARCYEKLGNKAQAHQYYQIMFDTVDKSKIGWQAEVNWYTAALKRTQS